MEIARQCAIHWETAWFFKRKIPESMKNGVNKLLKDVVQFNKDGFLGKTLEILRSAMQDKAQRQFGALDHDSHQSVYDRASRSLVHLFALSS